jgi:hypothetical protein
MAVPIGNAFADARLDEATLTLALREHTLGAVPRLERLWAYYRNPQTPIGTARAGAHASTSAGAHVTHATSRRYHQAQECGLPPRITGDYGAFPGLALGLMDDRAHARREKVIENDIAWRLSSMVDFLLGKPVTIHSLARDAALREALTRFLDQLFEHSGGIALLQDMALLCHVYGHVDLILRADGPALRTLARSMKPQRAGNVDDPDTTADHRTLEEALSAAARLMRIEVVEPRRGVAILDPRDYREINAYAIQTNTRAAGSPAPACDESTLSRLRSRLGWTPQQPERTPSNTTITEVISASAWHIYEDGVRVHESVPPTQGQIPVVHIQNIAQPFTYEGQGEVEPLIPLQDELNTRLSDRAARVTMQSFRMYLAKGIDGFANATVGPGQVWITDNPDASISEFGGDRACPGEESHIREIREAMDKASGVPPIAAGVVQARIGNLSSANALRITLMGVLSKTARKRVTYGRGISQLCRLALTALDATGIVGISDADRAVRLTWPDPLPEDLRDQAFAASIKQDLGVPDERLLAELGYQPTDPGVT